MHNRLPLGLLILSLLIFPLSFQQARAQTVSVTADDLYGWVENISGKDAEGRRAFVRAALQELDVPFVELPFDTSLTRRGTKQSIAGTNFVVRIGSDGPGLVVGAHYDAVPGSPGSNDNGAGVAVLLGLIADLSRAELPITLEFCFFDQEEKGLIGSAVFVREHARRQDHLAMINLDVVGFGSEIFAGPVGEGDDEMIMPRIQDAARAMGREVLARPLYPSSDHLSFARAGLENISISIVPEGDTQRVTDVLSGIKPTEENVPVVLRTMHTPKDGLDTIDPEAMLTTFTLVRTVILDLADTR